MPTIFKNQQQKEAQLNLHILIQVVICHCQTFGSSAAQSWILSAPTEAAPPS